MDSKIFERIILEENINLTSKDTNYNINDIITKKLAKKVEGKCIKEGYIKKDSIEIVNRSLGVLINSNFDSTVNYVVKYSADVCMLSNNQIIECEIFSIDKSQIICYVGEKSNSPVEIYLFKHHHVGNVDFINLRKEDTIKVKIIGTKYEFKDTQIIAIAEFLEKK